MSFNLKYDKKFDNCSDEDFVLLLTNKLLFNWKSESLSGIASPEVYIKKIFETYNNLTREKIWYLTILQLLRKYASNYKLQYMNDVVKNAITYIVKDAEINALATCQDLNTACFITTADCLVSSFSEDELENGPLFDKITSLKKELLKSTEKYIVKNNFKKEIIEETVPVENLKNKFFDYKEFFFQMFIIYFFTSHEHNLMSGIPQTEMDIRATCFDSVEQICELFLIKHKDTVADIYCSTIAKVQLSNN